MKALLRQRVLLSLALVLLVGSAPQLPARAQDLPRYFPETGKTVASRFLEYWNANGGLAQQGFPISEELQERSAIDGKVYTVQYFERAVFELHPENQPPYELLLSLLGVEAYYDKYPNGAPVQAANNAEGSVLFSETGRRLGGRFLQYWQSNGALAQQGYPISDEFEEVSPLDGRKYRVQYFERAVFELHPENPPPYDVLLSQLGTFRYKAMYVVQSPPAIAIPAPPNISREAYDYIQEALDFVQQTWLGRDHIDWVALRRKAVAMAAANNAQTPTDTHGALSAVVQSLADFHTTFSTPQDVAGEPENIPEAVGIAASYAKRMVTGVDPGSPAEKAGVQVGDIIVSVNGVPTEQLGASRFFTELYSGQHVDLSLGRGTHPAAQPFEVGIDHGKLPPALVPQGRRLEGTNGNIGYIALPSNLYTGIGTKYSSIVQQIIRDIDQTPVCEWVVDLQLATGGSIAWMVAGIGPVLGVQGEGHLGTFHYVDGKKVEWRYRDGKYIEGDAVIEKVEAHYELQRPMPPVAVLTGSGTASAGEAALISFLGRPGALTFGQPTRGVPTNRTAKALSDGAYLVVSSALEEDRTGHVYGMNEKIAPHQAVATNSRLVGTDDDPVLQAAVQWLSALPQCSR